MLVSEIKKQVRWCVDEENGIINPALADYEDNYFDNIVVSKIGAALQWCSLHADPLLLNGDGSMTTTSLSLTIDANGYITLPANTLRVIRVRAEEWSKAIYTLISEDSDEYLMQSDDTAKATNDRPQAALILTSPMKVQVFPKPSEGKNVSITYISMPDDTSSGFNDNQDVNVPSKIRGAFIYYLAYLVMVAHSDINKANMLLTVAKEHLGTPVK